uniref:Retrovirus-related Pol polyprotein from transposon TNT 1-94 n=1 Tax=Tanacetum cinerariifolium TaxID=118510 RepID=A0A6L2LFH7_TANCI|nr:retrovirus-related Pol polyprotein from transposon TNT 1-94 [Tanacetum cinerariifolium]
MASRMYKLDPIILDPQVKNNKEAYEYYLKHTMEQAAILRRDTCPDIHKPSKKLVAATPINMKKIVRFADTVTSSGNISKHPDKGAKALCFVCNECLFDANHVMCLIDYVNGMNVRAKFASKKHKKRKKWKPTEKVFNSIGYKWKPTGRTFTLVGNAYPLTSTVKFGNDQVEKIMRDMMASSLICLLSKAIKTKSWLWHRHLSHLNFGAINHLARHDLVRGLARIKFEKDQLCSACAMGKSKKQSHKPKFRDTNQEKLYLLHMNLCGPTRLVPNPSPLAPFVPPSRHEWDLVFQLVFDEFFSPSASVASLVLVEEALAHVESTGSPSSITVDQDEPSPKTVSEESSSSNVIPTTVHSDAPIS